MSSVSDRASGLLRVEGVCVERSGASVLRGVDVDVAPGEICALMGVSGAGKSTVLRTIAALQSFTAGRITVGDFVLAPGAVPSETRLHVLRRTVGMVFQAHALFEHLTALDNVMLAPIHALGWTRAQAETAAMELLTSHGVAARAQAYPRQLSGGEAQRVAIARALAPNPVLLLMDEPTSALDPARRSALGESLRALANAGRGLLIATHDVDFARLYADRVAVLAAGIVVEHGLASEVLSHHAIQGTSSPSR